ncbi:MAG: hypothetical protein RBU29_12785 [bacterium]|jgi:hypothetical protein|nr:hypothetical protein [bacterium]
MAEDSLKHTIQCLSEIKNLTKRIERLEKQNKKLKKKLLHGKTLEVETLILRDSDGNTRAVMEVSPQGTAYQVFYDSNQTKRAAFGVLNDGSPRILLYDEDGKERIKLQVKKEGQGAILFTDAQGITRLKIMVEGGEPHLCFIDKEGKETLSQGQ